MSAVASWAKEDRRRRARPLAGLAGGLLLVFAGCQSPTPSHLADTLASVEQSTAELPASPFRNILTVQTAIERAYASSDEIATLAASVDVAAQQRLAARDWRDPELRAAYGEDSGDTTREQFSSLVGTPAAPALPAGQSSGTISDQSSTYGVALRIFPPNPWTQDKALSAGDASTYAAVANLRDAQWRLASDVRRRFAEIDHADYDLRVLNNLTTLYSNAVETINSRAELGESTLENVLTASRRYLGVLAERDKSTRQRDQAKRDLAALVGVATDDLLLKIDANTFSEPDLGTADIQVLKSKALENRQDLAALNWQTQAAWATYQEAQTERWPWFTYVEASYGSTDSSADRHFTSTGATGLAPAENSSATDSGSDDQWAIATGITLPIFPGRSHGPNIRMAEYHRAKIQEERARVNAEREIGEAIRAVHAIAQSRASMARETEPILKQMQEGLTRLESTSGLNPEDVVRMREQILETQRLKLASSLDYRLAVIGLEDVLGMRLNGQGGAEAGKR